MSVTLDEHVTKRRTREEFCVVRQKVHSYVDLEQLWENTRVSYADDTLTFFFFDQPMKRRLTNLNCIETER